jgi:zinc/manganese transport system substrate-binding protein
MRDSRKLAIVLALLSAWTAHARSEAKLRVVASTADLAAIAREVGGERIEAESIVQGNQDPHFVELLPSYMMRVRKADVYIKVGMELDYWAQAILDGSRNARIEVVDCSLALPADRRLEVPTRADASMGDVHKYGNPHYWLDPENGRLIAGAIVRGLAKADPANAAAYESGLAAFEKKLDAKKAEWASKAEAIKGMKIVTYHNSWPYFTRAFGVEVVDWLEPKPGVKPSPTHVRELIETIRKQKVAAVAVEPYFESRTPEMIARETGVPLVALSPSVGGVPEVKDYFQLFDYNLGVLAAKAAR